MHMQYACMLMHVRIYIIDTYMYSTSVYVYVHVIHKKVCVYYVPMLSAMYVLHSVYDVNYFRARPCSVCKEPQTDMVSAPLYLISLA